MRRTVTGVGEGVSAGNSQGCPFGAREAPECSAENPREPGVTRSQPQGGRAAWVSPSSGKTVESREGGNGQGQAGQGQAGPASRASAGP